jgi:hypothetical protein
MSDVTMGRVTVSRNVFSVILKWKGIIRTRKLYVVECTAAVCQKR